MSTFRSPLRLSRSAFKKKKKERKRKLITTLEKTYSYRHCDPKDLPIIDWFKDNETLGENWLKDVLKQDRESEWAAVSLIYPFFIGQSEGHFEKSIGILEPRSCFLTKFIGFIQPKFEHQFEKYLRLIDTETQQKYSINKETIERLLGSISESVIYVWDRCTACPLHAFLSAQNDASGAGWLFVLLCQYTEMNKNMKPPDDALYLITILFNILLGSGKHIEGLALALGRSGTKKVCKRWLRKHAQNVSRDFVEKESASYSPKSIRTATTACTSLLAEDIPDSASGDGSPRYILPSAVSIPYERENTSPLTTSEVHSPSTTIEVPCSSPVQVGSPMSIVIGRKNISPKTTQDDIDKQTILSPMNPSHSPTKTPNSCSRTSAMSIATTNPRTRVKKKVCLNETPSFADTGRTLFPLDDAEKHPQSSSLSFECQQLVEMLQEATDDTDFERLALDFVSSRADRNGVLLNKKIVDDSRPMTRTLKSSTTRLNRLKWIKLKIPDVLALLKSIVSAASDEEEKEIQKDILKKTLESHFECLVYDKAESSEDIVAVEVMECIVRAGMNVTTVAAVKLLRDFSKLLIKKKKLREAKIPLEGQLRTKIGKLERTCAIPATFKLVDCYVAKEERQSCVFYYIESVPLLLERLVGNCIREGSIEDSLKFSSLKDKLVFRFGADRGGNDLIMMMSLAIRRRGNHGRYSIPIGVVEGASETYSNLQKTIYSPARKAILEQLVNQKLVMIRMCFGKVESIQVVKCIVLELTGVNRVKLAKTKFKVSVIGTNDAVVDQTWNATAYERDTANSVSINDDMFSRNDEHQLDLSIELIGDGLQYIGCRLLSTQTSSELFCFEFDYGVNVAFDCFTADCLHMIGVPCEDGKMCATIYGLSTCNSSFPCPKCLWPVSEKSVPNWVGNYGTRTDTGGVTEKCNDHRKRIDAHSRKKCNDDFIRLCGDLTDNPPMRYKKMAYSVVKTPLLHIDDNLLYLHSGGPMHISQGLMTHLTEKTSLQLMRAGSDDDTAFLKDEIEKVNAYVVEIEKIKSTEAFVCARQRYKRGDKKVILAYQKLQTAI